MSSFFKISDTVLRKMDVSLELEGNAFEGESHSELSHLHFSIPRRAITVFCGFCSGIIGFIAGVAVTVLTVEFDSFVETSFFSLSIYPCNAFTCPCRLFLDCWMFCLNSLLAFSSWPYHS